MKTNWYYRWNLPGCLPDTDTPFEDGDSFEAIKAALLETLESRMDEALLFEGDNSKCIYQWNNCIVEVSRWKEKDCPNYVTGPDGHNYCIDTLD